MTNIKSWFYKKNKLSNNITKRMACTNTTQRKKGFDKSVSSQN